MSASFYTDEDLTAYLDEALPTDQQAAVESELRDSEMLRRRLAMLSAKRDQGVHSVGEIWRRERLSCLSRSQLGAYLLGTQSAEMTAYTEFHLYTVGCRYCAANLHDLQQEHDNLAAGDSAEKRTRQQKYFESSAGYLPKPG